KLISTANTYPLCPSTNLMHDGYGRIIAPGATDTEKLFMSRVIVVLLGAFAVLQATRLESILNAALYAYTVYGAAVTPAVMAVFFWRRATTAGATTSIVLGTVVTIGWNLAGFEQDQAVYSARGASVLSLLLVSFLTPPPAPQKW